MIRSIIVLLALASASIFFASASQARTHYHAHHVTRHHVRHAHHRVVRRRHVRHRTVRGLADARPAAWCGYFARHHLVAHDPGPLYNLARAWARWGRNAGGPQVGAIVVWAHHVGRIEGRAGGQWIVHSGNDGHRVRTRPRSLRGAIAFRLPAQRMASY